MAEGRIAVVLDPEGYSYASEEGNSFSFDGQVFTDKPDLLGHVQQGQNMFWSAPGSPWLAPRPKPFDKTWCNHNERAKPLHPPQLWAYPTSPKVQDGVEYPDHVVLFTPVLEREQWISIVTAEDYLGEGAPISPNLYLFDDTNLGIHSLLTAL